jgi:selenocysteine lyase/cysteine desulfurase
MLAMSNALAFRDSLGGDAAILPYMHQLAVKGGDAMVEAWGTDKLVSDDVVAAMTNVRLPAEAEKFCSFALTNARLKQYNSRVPFYPRNVGKCYVRVTAQIYNEVSDFEFLAKSVSKLLADVASIPGCNGTEHA